MPYIKQIPINQAKGLVKKELEKAVKRAGRIWEHRTDHVAKRARDESLDGDVWRHNVRRISPVAAAA